MKFREKIARFMYGRNGNDRLNNFILIIAMIIAIIEIFIHSFVLSFVFISLWILTIFRMMSKNLPKRQRENAKYVSLINSVKGKFALAKNKHRDRKTHVYKKCPKCKAVLRLPKVKGKHTVCCPKCKNKFDVKI